MFGSIAPRHRRYLSDERHCRPKNDRKHARGDLKTRLRATEVLACATHPILSDPACERLNQSRLSEVVTTNTIPLRAKAQAELGSLKVLSVASLIAEAIRRIHNEESVSSLFT